MAENPWWRGTDSELNDRALDFIFAMQGLALTYDRINIEADDVPMTTVIEASWWIGAAAEACGRRHRGGLLEAFYWVRNKGFHQLTTALGSIVPSISDEELVGTAMVGDRRVRVFGTPQLWQRLDGPADGSRAAYNEHLAGQSVLVTIQKAFLELAEHAQEIWEDADLGRLGLPPIELGNSKPSKH